MSVRIAAIMPDQPCVAYIYTRRGQQTKYEWFDCARKVSAILGRATDRITLEDALSSVLLESYIALFRIHLPQAWTHHHPRITPRWTPAHLQLLNLPRRTFIRPFGGEGSLMRSTAVSVLSMGKSCDWAIPRQAQYIYISCCGDTKSIFIVHVEDCTAGFENGSAVEVGFKNSWELLICPHDSHVLAPSQWSLLPSISPYVASLAILPMFQDREDGSRPNHTRNDLPLTHLHIYA